MSRSVLCVVLFAVVCGLATSGSAELIAHWRFDEDFADTVGDFGGTPQGDAALSAEAKFGAGALQVDGDGDYVDLGAAGRAFDFAGDLTVSVWVKAHEVGEDDNIIIGKGWDGGQTPFWLMLLTERSARCGHYEGGHQGVDGDVPAGGSFLDGKWHIVTGVIDDQGGTADYILYIDGIKVAENLGSADINPGGTTNTWIGGIDEGNNKWFFGLIDDLRIYDHALSQEEIAVLMQGGVVAYAANPADKAVDVPLDETLSWTAADRAVSHDVYWGTVFDDVNEASRSNPLNVLVAEELEINTFAPGVLEYGQTYYWRVDEVNDADPASPWKGRVWSFTTEPYSYPIEGITATASSSLSSDLGPQRTVDGSGLNGEDGHSAEMGDMWVSDAEPDGAWIQYTFDTTCKLDRMLIWNFNAVFESILGWGLKDVTIETSENGTDWTLFDEVELAQATSADGYRPDKVIEFGGVLAKAIRLTAQNNWGEMIDLYGLSEVRILNVVGRAREPQPTDGAGSVDLYSTLKWRVGREAALHDIYFGTDANQLAFVDTVASNSYDLANLDLEFGETYFWRVDEVNDAETPGVWEGDVWRFSTPEYFALDDFEGYNDDYENYNRVFQIWIDGAGYTQPEPGDPGNGSGSLVGTSQAPWVELSTVQSGRQAMPISYRNTDGVDYSEVVRTFGTPQDWTANGIKSLSVYLYGDAANTGQLYVKINAGRVDCDSTIVDIMEPQWQAWNIDLSTVDADMTNVTSLTIGIDGAGASGILYVDDIRLYPESSQSSPSEE